MADINNAKAIPVLLKVAADEKAELSIREAAIHALQQFTDPAIATTLIKLYPAKLRSKESLRQATFNLLSSRSNWALAFLKAIPETKISSPLTTGIDGSEVSVQTIRQLLALSDPEVTTMVKRRWSETGAASAGDKNQRIRQVKQVLSYAEGNAARGHAIFLNTCGGCHRLFGEGGTIGPDLTGYDRKNLNDLLVNIIDPNAYIREGYVMSQVTTTDGRTIMGTIKARSGNTITLQSLSGEQSILPNDKIKQLHELPSSLMPEKLIDGLTDQETRDFFSYLMKQQGK